MKLFLILLITFFSFNSYSQEFLTCSHPEEHKKKFKDNVAQSFWTLDIDNKVLKINGIILRDTGEKIEFGDGKYEIYEKSDQFIKSFIIEPINGQNTRIEEHFNIDTYELYNTLFDETKLCESDNKKNYREVANFPKVLGPTKELEQAYIFYLIIKNLNKNYLYGSNTQIDDSKKLIKKIEIFYKKQITSDFDSIWDSAKDKYLRKHAGNVDSLSSSYSAMGQSFFDINMIGLTERAKEIGVSSSNTDKDF